MLHAKTMEAMFNVDPNMRIIRAEIVNEGKAIKAYYISEQEAQKLNGQIQNGGIVFQKVVTKVYYSKEYFDVMFPVVEARKLSHSDKFLQYEPETALEMKVKESIIEGIKSGLEDFRKPALDPSIDEDGNVIFEFGGKPAVKHSARYWNKKARILIPEKNSRYGIEMQYDAFLAVIMKGLMDKYRYTARQAWKSVCVESSGLGHFSNSENADNKLEPTGGRKILNWYDLGNTSKIIFNNQRTAFLIVSGDFESSGGLFPLAFRGKICNANREYECAVPWIVSDV